RHLAGLFVICARCWPRFQPLSGRHDDIGANIERLTKINLRALNKSARWLQRIKGHTLRCPATASNGSNRTRKGCDLLEIASLLFVCRSGRKRLPAAASLIGITLEFKHHAVCADPQWRNP